MFFGYFFASFSKNWHKNVTKFPFRMAKILYKVFPTFLQNFFTISLKLERNIFSILCNFRKINNLKLPWCFSIIFSELIQNLLFLHFFEVFRRFRENIQKNPQNNFIISQKCSQNIQHFSKVFRKYSKICFPKLT